jgi:hypothetical protein
MWFMSFKVCYVNRDSDKIYEFHDMFENDMRST